ncbi:MAG: c-type cytochrome [Planctomycetes bacterium]|nr:c-type cytochrome [Planctomycetota bacterium]
MAATDKYFNDQNTLDIVFGVSNILMLLSIFWMFWQDYNREYKAEQRIFREIEVEMANREAIKSIPSQGEFDAKAAKVVELREKKKSKAGELSAAEAKIFSLKPKRERAEAEFQAAKSDVESITSFRSGALEEKNDKLAATYDKQLVDLNKRLDDAQAKRDGIVSEMKLEQQKIDAIEGELTKAVAEFKKVNDRFDSQVKLALNKRWGWGDRFRTLPVINGFADPLKIHQFTINDIPIDYNFKQVTRFDRCMSCHQGIEKANFTRANLEALWKTEDSQKQIDEAIANHKKRLEALDPREHGTIPDPSGLAVTAISKDVLTPARVTEFCAHPRLDLFVGPNSKHPAEKFGCTSCHSGQGSGTSFTDASHGPNTLEDKHRWAKERGYEFNHQWDFQMLPKRFIESSCLKCHHEVTDLISRDNRVEAPKLLRGHTLIKENGCFGCHEISGWKGGVRVGPDLRLEPSTPLEHMHPIERERVVNDPDNRPGTMRKVGPSLARVNEKLHKDFIAKWVRSPSGFRPHTKMPHYYGLSTNDKSVLPDDQKTHPDTEIISIAHFLSETSKKYLDDTAKIKGDRDSRRKDEDRLLELLNKGRLIENEKVKEQTELGQVKDRIRSRKEIELLDDVMRQAAPVLAKGYKANGVAGRDLFIEKGCLACHTHQASETSAGKSPAIVSDAVFGPNLSQIAEKFAGNENARKFLVTWILNPQVHNPRTRMPVTHLTAIEAANIAEWLMTQKYNRDADDPWNKVAIDQPKTKDLQELARVYLRRMLSKSDMEKFLEGGFKDGADWDVVKGDLTADEKALRDSVKNEDALKFYLGKKAVTRLGCFACHDIPGFENTKSIGVGLNDWGKKPADRLAFEDISNFFAKHYQTEDPHNMKGDKEPYEPFYAEALTGHHRQREGYLNQKIRDPRSYDYNRIRAWDDRARMPKFTLGRPRKKDGEKDDAFKARTFKEEADAREAVATFVLGLVAEQVPTKSINQPTGDRLAEIKGRQVLDKYNCAGCHTIRPGLYDFKLGLTVDTLENVHGNERSEMVGEVVHAGDHHWTGRNSVGGERVAAFATQATFKSKSKSVVLVLSEAFRFVGKDKSVKNIPSGVEIEIELADLFDDPTKITSQADLDRALQTVSPHGGTFTELMVGWLAEKKPDNFKASRDRARAFLPPPLIGQGERTQPSWLKQFLLDPHKVRPMPILRMPRFNMSEIEAQALVDYFAAVAKQSNPGIGLPYPHESIPQRGELSSAYWRNKTAEYLQHLDKTKSRDERVSVLTPVWEQIQKDREPVLTSALAAKGKEIDAMTEKLPMEKDAKKKQEMQDQITALKEEQKQLEVEIAQLSVVEQRKRWELQEAYAVDAYRLLMHRETCTKCHQVGNALAVEQVLQGPPLHLVAERLRPDWVERWVANPKRFAHYTTMIQYFSHAKTQYQTHFAGSADDQIRAVRDALMNFPRVSSLPANRVPVVIQAVPKK